MFFQGAGIFIFFYFFNIIYKSAILLQILLTHVSLKSTVSDELFLTYFESIYFLATYIFFSETKTALSHQRSVIYTPPSRVSSYYQNAVMFV